MSGCPPRRHRGQPSGSEARSDPIRTTGSSRQPCWSRDRLRVTAPPCSSATHTEPVGHGDALGAEPSSGIEARPVRERVDLRRRPGRKSSARRNRRRSPSVAEAGSGCRRFRDGGRRQVYAHQARELVDPERRVVGSEPARVALRSPTWIRLVWPERRRREPPLRPARSGPGPSPRRRRARRRWRSVATRPARRVSVRAVTPTGSHRSSESLADRCRVRAVCRSKSSK